MSSTLFFFFVFFFCAPTRRPFFFCVMFVFHLWAFHVWLAQSRGGLENAQRFGERVLLQPPLLLLRSHFPEKLLPGLPGLPQLPCRQWEPQEVRGAAQMKSPLLRPKHTCQGFWQKRGGEMGGRDKLVFAGMAVAAFMLAVKPFNTRLCTLPLSINNDFLLVKTLSSCYFFFPHRLCSWTRPLPVSHRNRGGC